MAQERNVMLALAVAALTFGLGDGMTPAPREIPLANSDIVIVKNEAASPSVNTEENAEQSAKMGKDEGIHVGQDQANAQETGSAKMSGSSAPIPPAPEDNDIAKE